MAKYEIKDGVGITGRKGYFQKNRYIRKRLDLHEKSGFHIIFVINGLILP